MTPVHITWGKVYYGGEARPPGLQPQRPTPVHRPCGPRTELLSCTPATRSSWSCALTPGSRASSSATQTRWVLPGPGVACTQRLHNSPQPATSPGLCSGTGWEQLSAGLSPGTPPQRAAPLGLPDQELPVPVPEPCPHRLLPQVGEGPLRWVRAAPVTLTVSSTSTASPTVGHYSAALARTAMGRW